MREGHKTHKTLHTRLPFDTPQYLPYPNYLLATFSPTPNHPKMSPLPPDFPPAASASFSSIPEDFISNGAGEEEEEGGRGEGRRAPTDEELEEVVSAVVF